MIREVKGANDMSRWKTRLVSTARGTFEVFIKGKGLPLCVTHHYSEFNDSGDYFADSFTEIQQPVPFMKQILEPGFRYIHT
jgi:hypothetical protein